ncbi:MAG: hypothetical protein NWF01_07305 [Candidatus Bathyarchaeota archaeon]|nr:hypothetical protein [Candidatus Bathyarchaeota archaeon]
MGKFGRKVCCDYNQNIKCILLSKGKKHCIFKETTPTQEQNGQVQLGVCALLPEKEREGLIAALKKENPSDLKTWKD